MDVRNKIIEWYRAHPGVDPHFKTLGTNWHEAHPVYQQLKAEGILVERIVPSATGRKMRKLFLNEGRNG